MTKAEEKKALLAALDTIRQQCIAAEGCINCPLCVARGCQLQLVRPSDWQLSTEAPKVWHAFYDKD